jgi:hypothetical protein
MIKFFRHIRKSLLTENKFSKYLLYAVGEIVLVVIGILIALQINNFNEQKKDREKEQVVLKQLKEDYETNLIQLKQKMEMRNEIVSSAFNVLKAIDYPDKIVRDTLIMNIAKVDNNPTFDPIENDLISSGNLRLVKNEKLKRLLTNWSSDLVALQEVEVSWSNKMGQQYEPLLGKLGISRDVLNYWIKSSDQNWLLDNDNNTTRSTIGNSKYSVPIDEIINSRKLEGLVSEAITYNRPANVQSEALFNRINEIIELIESEIND